MSAETDHTYPYSHIFIGKEKTIAICGSSVFVLNSESGSLLSSVEVNSSEKNILPIIRVAAVDSSYEHLVTSGDDKRLRVWSTETLEELSSREVPKRANELKMTHDGQTILAADKFGDIFSYSLIPSKPKAIFTAQPDNGTASSSKSISVAMHDNPEGTLILGHASIITAFILTPDERLVVSADRDEHIRVSWYPEGWDVEKYCMGHKKFVSALEIPSCAPSILLSGGGDPELHVWDYRAGQLLTQIPVWEQVRPFIKVRGGRKQWKDHGEGKWLSKGKGKGKKGKGKADDTLAPGTDDTMDTSPDKQDLVGAVYDDEVLVVSHIRHARLDSTDVVIFSAVGASALFYFQWPSSLNFAEISVQSIDLLNPVTGIIILDNQIWVSVDPSWAIGPGAIGGPQSADQRRLRLLVWKDSTMIEAGSESHLLKSLNETCAIKGSSKDIQALDLYDPLIALPKIAEPESLDGSMDPEESGTPVPSDITSGPGLRASARQKVKEQLEKRKAMAQDLAQNQKNAKQPRVEGP